MNVAADMAVWCHVRVATVGVRWVLSMTGASSASYLVEYCSTGYGGSCDSLIAACMSAAFIFAVFLSLGGAAVCCYVYATNNAMMRYTM